MSTPSRFPKWKSVDEMRKQIEQYVEDCKGTPLLDKDGNPVVTKWGEAVLVGQRPLTVSGLALALGFKSRSDLRHYKGKKMFEDELERAMLLIEQSTEERLFDKEGANGARFSLQNNFSEWTETKTDPNASAPTVKIVCDLPKQAPKSVAGAVIEEVEKERAGLEAQRQAQRAKEDAEDAVEDN